MLMLEHKRVPYRRVDIVTLLHPVSSGCTDSTRAGRRAPRADGARSGCAWATASAPCRRSPPNGERISTNHGIARFLDERHPEPPLFPADPEQRRGGRGGRALGERDAADGRPPDPGRGGGARPGGVQPVAGRRPDGVPALQAGAHAAPDHPADRRAGSSPPARAAERELLAELPAMLDRIDAWIADGVLGGAQLNAADFMVAPSLALILYRPDVMPLFEGRPALELVDRLAGRGGSPATRARRRRPWWRRASPSATAARTCGAWARCRCRGARSPSRRRASAISSTGMPISSSEVIEAAAWEIAQPWPWKRRSLTLPSSTTQVHAELVAAERVVVVPLEVVRVELAEVPRVLVVLEDVVPVEGVHSELEPEHLAPLRRAPRPAGRPRRASCRRGTTPARWRPRRGSA